jgi:hypothetical protein
MPCDHQHFNRPLTASVFFSWHLSNGWGFRRLTEGANMGSYYEENFLRSMPWLVKNMKRPKVGEKKPRGTRKCL